MGAPVDPSYTQTRFRFRNDNGGEVAATWKAAENTAISQEVNQVLRLRLQVAQTVTNANRNLAKNFRVRFAQNGGGYTDVGVIGGTAVAVRYADSGSVTDGLSTSAQLTAAGGTFLEGVVDNNNDTGTLTFSIEQYTELEFVLELYGPLLSEGDTLDFRVYETSSTALNLYSATPRATAAKFFRSGSAQVRATGRITAAGRKNSSGAGPIQTVARITPSTRASRSGAGGTIRATPRITLAPQRSHADTASVSAVPRLQADGLATRTPFVGAEQRPGVSIATHMLAVAPIAFQAAPRIDKRKGAALVRATPRIQVNSLKAITGAALVRAATRILPAWRKWASRNATVWATARLTPAWRKSASDSNRIFAAARLVVYGTKSIRYAVRIFAVASLEAYGTPYEIPQPTNLSVITPGPVTLARVTWQWAA